MALSFDVWALNPFDWRQSLLFPRAPRLSAVIRSAFGDNRRRVCTPFSHTLRHLPVGPCFPARVVGL